MAELRKRRHNLEAPRNVLQVPADSHLDVALDQPWTALGVKTDIVKRRSWTASGVVSAVCAVFEELAQELGSFAIGGAGGGRTADARPRQDCLQRLGTEVVQLLILLR